MADVHEAAKKILNGEEFSLRLQELVTEAVAQAVNRVNEAAEARIATLESELSAAKAKLAEAEQHIDSLDAYNQSPHQPGDHRSAGEARRSDRQPGEGCRPGRGPGAVGRQPGQIPPGGVEV